MPASPTTYHAPRRLHAGHSLLARLLRRKVADPRRAEAYLILAVCIGGALLVMVHYTAWALLAPYLDAGASRGLAAALWLGQAGTALAFTAAAVLGFAPTIRVTATDGALHIEQGDRTCVLPYDSLDALAPLDPGVAHRHYRRYAGTRWFVHRPTGPLLLLHTPDAPLVLGLPEPALQALTAHLTPLQSPEPAYPTAQVA